jgi:hypothetical protein
MRDHVMSPTLSGQITCAAFGHERDFSQIHGMAPVYQDY